MSTRKRDRDDPEDTDSSKKQDVPDIDPSEKQQTSALLKKQHIRLDQYHHVPHQEHWINWNIFPWKSDNYNDVTVWDYYDKNAIADTTPLRSSSILEWWSAQVHLSNTVPFVVVVGLPDEEVHSIIQLLESAHAFTTVEFLAISCPDSLRMPQQMRLWNLCKSALVTLVITYDEWPKRSERNEGVTSKEDRDRSKHQWLTECLELLKDCRKLTKLHFWYQVPLSFIRQVIEICPSLDYISLADMSSDDAAFCHWQYASPYSLLYDYRNPGTTTHRSRQPNADKGRTCTDNGKRDEGEIESKFPNKGKGAMIAPYDNRIEENQGESTCLLLEMTEKVSSVAPEEDADSWKLQSHIDLTEPRVADDASLQTEEEVPAQSEGTAAHLLSAEERMRSQLEQFFNYVKQLQASRPITVVPTWPYHSRSSAAADINAEKPSSWLYPLNEDLSDVLRSRPRRYSRFGNMYRETLENRHAASSSTSAFVASSSVVHVLPADSLLLKIQGYSGSKIREWALFAAGQVAPSGETLYSMVMSSLGSRPVVPVKVAVLDSGAELLLHPCLWSKVDKVATFIPYENVLQDVYGHGTHCAGIVVKTFPECRLMIGKVLSNDPYDYQISNYQALVEGIRWAVYECEADVISLSLGRVQYGYEIDKAIGDAVNRGVTVVCAASNFGRKSSYSIHWPARLGNVICVGSHDGHGQSSLFSSVGQEVDFLAPGEGVYSTLPHGFGVMSGTSQATPYVAAVVAMILHYDRSHRNLIRSSQQVKALLKSTCTTSGHHDEASGYGVLRPAKLFVSLQHFYTELQNA